MVTNRTYTSRRSGITKALADKLAEIDGRGLFRSSVAETSARLKFWDEVEGIRHPGPFIQASETPLRRLEAAPRLGEHQSDVDLCREPPPEIPEPGNATKTNSPLEGL